MNDQKKLQRLIGMALGAVTSLPVVALSFMGNRLVGLPFVAFNLLDYITRIVPRLMVLVGIDRLLQGQETSTPNLGALSGVVQPLVALLSVAIVGALFGLILANLGRREARGQRLPLFGAIGGIVLGSLFSLINNYLGFSPAGPLASILSLGALMVLWGVILGWMMQRALFPAPETEEIDLARRRWLYVAGSAVVAVVAGGLGFLLPRQRRERPQEQATGDGEQPVFKENADAEPPSPEEIGVSDTSDPADSPPLEELQARIEPVPGTRPEITPNADFYNIDINTNPPVLDPASWRVEIKGLVRQPTTLTLSDIKSFPTYSQFITLSCISNNVGGTLISTSKWTGIRLKDLLEDVGLRPAAQEIYIEAADGFYESVSMEDMMDPRTLLVYEMNEEPLPYEHGYPLRIYIPNRFGMKQPKWIVSMEVINQEGPGYWVDRGWSAEAIARTTSVIDNVAVDAVQDDRLPVGGIAWAGARGISKVEVKVDEGQWMEARLRTPALSPLTWVQWRYDWPIQPGQHVARVRAYDGEGEPQVQEETGRRPDGATGIDSVSFEI